MRDSQRSKVYRAQDPAIQGSPEIEFDECVLFAKRVWDNPVVKKRFQKAFVLDIPLIEKGRKNGYATAHFVDERIVLPPGNRNVYTVLHELAHIITERQYTENQDWILHNWQFCDTYLFLIRKMIGLQAWSEMIEAFVKQKVKFQPHKYPHGLVI